MRRFLDWIWRAVLIAAVGGFYALAIVNRANAEQPVVAGLILSVGLVLLVLLLLAPINRLSKGIFLVGLAVLSTLIYSTFVEPLFALLGATNGTVLSEDGVDIARHEYFTSGTSGAELLASLGINQAEFFRKAATIFSNFTLLINLACAGAGGSLIALEGDRTSRDIGDPGQQTTPPAPALVPDAAPSIRSLTEKVDSQAGVLASLDRQISTVDQRISILLAQQARFGRKLVIGGIIGAAVLGFALGALVFSKI